MLSPVLQICQEYKSEETVELKAKCPSFCQKQRSEVFRDVR